MGSDLYCGWIVYPYIVINGIYTITIAISINDIIAIFSYCILLFSEDILYFTIAGLA